MSDTNSIDDGGPAFPVHGFTANASGSLDGTYIREPGMSIRDWFAGQAIAGMLAYSGNDGKCSWSSNASTNVVADDAYHYADAMLAARKQT